MTDYAAGVPAYAMTREEQDMCIHMLDDPRSLDDADRSFVHDMLYRGLGLAGDERVKLMAIHSAWQQMSSQVCCGGH